MGSRHLYRADCMGQKEKEKNISSGTHGDLGLRNSFSFIILDE